MRLAHAVVLALVAGCLTPEPAARPQPSVLPSLADLDPPEVDAGRARLWWEDFVSNTPYRHTGSSTNAAASERLHAELEAAGYEARTFYYVPGTLIGLPLPAGGGESPVAGGIRAIVGIKAGSTQPERVIGWVAHYDTSQTTVYGAYDDGSGTAVALELARVLSTYDSNKTLMPIFFDGEELGTVASDAFVRQAMASEEHRFDMVIGHDMTGINCPGHDWPMYQMVGENFADVLLPIQEALYRDVMKVDYAIASMEVTQETAPDACVVILDGHDRDSDEAHFKRADVPILRMAGGRAAADYPAYHQVNDTIEYLYGFTGGPENYEKGLRITIEASWWNVVIFDRLPSLVP